MQENKFLELNDALHVLKKELGNQLKLLAEGSDQVAYEAYKAYLIDKTKKSPEQIVSDACSELEFLLSSITVHNDLCQYTQARKSYVSSVEALCILMKTLTGDELLSPDSFSTKKNELSDITVRLAQKGITLNWLLSHGLASEQDTVKLQQSSDITGISYRKIKNGIRIDAVDMSGGIVIPELIEGIPVVKIAARAFYKRKDITSVILPRRLIEIEDEAFSESGIVSIVIPDNVEKIGERAFYNCRQLESIKLSKELKSIKYKTFSGCAVLSTIKIPRNVASIGDYAFERCRKLKSIQLPDSVARFGSWIFSSKPIVYCNNNTRASRYVEENYMPSHKPYDMYDGEN